MKTIKLITVSNKTLSQETFENIEEPLKILALKFKENFKEDFNFALFSKEDEQFTIKTKDKIIIGLIL